MSTPLLNCFIFICKLMVCICTFLSVETHHWVRDNDGESYGGMRKQCYNYGGSCYERPIIAEVIWTFFALVVINVILELLNLLLLYKRRRSRINLILEELGIIASIIYVLPIAFVTTLMLIFFKVRGGRLLDWSYFILLLSVVLAFIELICSFVRVVSYCRDNTFRSSVITYTSNNNHEAVHIQT